MKGSSHIRKDIIIAIKKDLPFISPIKDV